MQEIWTVYNKGADFYEIGKKYGIDPVTAKIMRNRDVVTDEEMDLYLGVGSFTGYDGALLKDMEKACQIMLDHMREGKRIRIISDYDVDGMMSNYVLYKGLKRVYREILESPGMIDYVIPHRMKDGYGLNKRMILDCIADQVDLLITCDNGIAAKEEILFAEESGIQVIVTDHHEVQGEIPKASAVVDPKQEDCAYPFKEICGAVVAYKFIEQMYQLVGIESKELESFHIYIAMATVCDVMKLIGENRYIVKRGIELLNLKLHNQDLDTGLFALIKANQLEDKILSATTFGFILGPCLNATGRLSTALWGMRLLLEKDEKKANYRAKRLTQMNQIRKEMSSKFEKIAFSLAEEYEQDKVLVLYLKECHESIAGIVAGRVREKTGKPTIILTKAHESGMVKGSARSIPEYNIFEHLLNQQELLVHFGGHPMAAGMSLKEEHVNILRQRLNDSAHLTQKDVAIKRHIDAVMPISYITQELIEDLKKLEPFGNGNEKPLFAVRDLVLIGGRVVGAKKNVLRLTFLTPEGNRVIGVYFGENPLSLLKQAGESKNIDFASLIEGNKSFRYLVSVMYAPTINEYMGNKTVELRLISIK